MVTDDFNKIMSLDDAGFVDGLYPLLLRREPDPDGRKAVLAALKKGGDRRKLALYMVGSAEARKYSRELRALQQTLEIEIAQYSRAPERRIVGWLTAGPMAGPVAVLKRLRPRYRLLVVARVAKAILLRPFAGLLPEKKEPVLRPVAVSYLPLDSSIEIPESLSESAAHIYRDIISRLPTHTDRH